MLAGNRRRGQAPQGHGPTPYRAAENRQPRPLAFSCPVRLTSNEMSEQLRRSWFQSHIENALVRGLSRAYETVKVDPAHFLLQLRAAYGLPVTSFHGVYSVEINVLDDLASRIVRGAMKAAAAEGAGLGLGGILTIVPDLSILAGITLRTVQKLSLLYGFEYNTDEETAELWIAAASAAGVDVSRELLEKEVVNRFVPRVIRRIAVQASGEVVEKWAGRVIPLASSLIGAALNYYFVRAWGKRAQAHFRQKHLEMRRKFATGESGLPLTGSSQHLLS
jgi:EcsC protein family